MAPIIHLVRHAQGFHNLSKENEQIPDPDLTPLGLDQCKKLQERFDAHDKITHLVASPIRRTLYTCLLSFEPAVKAGKKVTALPDAQEVSRQPCDCGSDPEKLVAEFGDKVDLTLVTKGWNDKSPSSKYAPEPEKLDARARDARLFLRELAKKHGDDSQIVLVTHGAILHFLTQDWEGINPGKGTAWDNTEWRSYQFLDSTYQDPDASLLETETSWSQRKGAALRLSAEQHKQLRAEYFSRVEEEEKQQQQQKAANGHA